jgi:hypothetical protein
MKRRVYAPRKDHMPGLYEVSVYLMGGREYVWKGRAKDHEMSWKLAGKRLTRLPVAMYSTKVRD